MRAFKDAEGREWLIDLNVDNLREVSARTEVDLTQLFQDDEVTKALERTFIVADILWVLCESQRSISKKDFDKGLKGDAVDHAEKSLMEALVDFFPSRQRTLLRKAMEVPETAHEEVEKELHKAVEKLKEERVARTDSMSGQESMNTPESAESIPAASP